MAKTGPFIILLCLTADNFTLSDHLSSLTLSILDRLFYYFISVVCCVGRVETQIEI